MPEVPRRLVAPVSVAAGARRGRSSRRGVIHELQCEPWGPEATVNISDEEQEKSMNPEIFANMISYASRTRINLSGAINLKETKGLSIALATCKMIRCKF